MEILPASTIYHPFNLFILHYFFITLPVSACHECFFRALLDKQAQDPSFVLPHLLGSTPRRGGLSLSDPASFQCLILGLMSMYIFLALRWWQDGARPWHHLQLPPSKANAPLIDGISFWRKHSECISFRSPHLGVILNAFHRFITF